MNLIRLMHVHVLVLMKYFRYHVDQKAKPIKFFYMDCFIVQKIFIIDKRYT